MVGKVKFYPPGEMPMSVAGRKGGIATATKYPPEHYEAIGRQGAERKKELAAARRAQETEAAE